MQSDKPSSMFLKEVMDIGEQLTLLGEHRKGLLEADTIVAFHDALDRFCQSMEVLQVCVWSLTHKPILTQRDSHEAVASAEERADTEAGRSTEADSRGGLIRALLKRRGLT
jgi:hypothetical protein